VIARVDVMTVGEKQKQPAQLQSLLDLPQERITGDVLRGYGPRRGNLERLLRYWRPIMKKPGGFRRCLVILANHPELYPLERLCAWLHHETTGLWPNEGCHHPGMRNCRGKPRMGRNGSLWSDREWNRRLTRRFRNKKSLESQNIRDVVTEDDFNHAMKVFDDFCKMEPEFVKFITSRVQWDHFGEDENGETVFHYRVKPEKGCGCGCG